MSFAKNMAPLEQQVNGFYLYLLQRCLYFAATSYAPPACLTATLSLWFQCSKNTFEFYGHSYTFAP